MRRFAWALACVRGSREPGRCGGVAVVATVVGCLAGCAEKAHAPSERALEVVVSTAPEVIDPRGSSDAISFRVTRLLHAGLFRLGEDLAPIPYVAKDYEWRDPRTLVVTLRHDVTFASGKPVRADDVVATIAAFQAEGSRQRRVVEAIGSVTAEADDRVRFELARPHGTLLSDLELPILRADQATQPIQPNGGLDGLGPYTLAAGAFDASALRLEPRTGGALPAPHRGLVIRTVRDENARAMRLMAGSADVVHNGLSPELWPALDEFHELALATRPAANLTYLVVRHGSQSPLDDVRLRQALSMALDREGMCAAFFHGHARPARSALSPIHWAYDANAPAFRYDLEAARALVREHGAVHLVLTTSTDRLRLLVARYMAQELATIGIDVTVEALELGTLLSRLSRGDFQLAILQMPELTEPNALKTFLHGGFEPPNGVNRGRYADADLDRALDAGEAEQDLTVRKAHYVEVERLLRERLPIVPLWHEDQIVVTSPRARAFLPSPEGRWLGLAQL